MVSQLSTRSVALIFAGQGNPVIGMGADLWDLNAVTKNIWDCASDVTQMDIRRLCERGPMNRLVQTTAQQVAVTAINVTLYCLSLEKMPSLPTVGSCGHSVGEYSALFAAGAFSLEALFRMIHTRSNIMNDLSKINKGTMLAVKGADFKTLTNMISASGIPVEVSCDNSCRQQVIGGATADLGRISHILNGAGLEVIKLGVSGAWHTSLMTDGVPLMRDFLQKIDIRSPNYSVLMNVTGQAEFRPEQIKENLALHLTHTVQWTNSITAHLQNSHPVTFLEFSNKAYLGQLLYDFRRLAPENIVHCRKLIGL
ncbi:ACP S-malonyltransferase [Klebsiella michiganensis]|uniref:ACP S-malonyltransferase n=1 Tax=Klebsiella michiganensis TaxID=1134687 RepID=UPI0012B8DD0A|nr:ACP S-malonyltransferase [Klebsiella michiganensis]MBE0114788.1 ACP S-malonyltransferase [Klebsiella michiganensis]MBZ6644698.1 ACP S-malonyltransferase [Klebsiella michiganensis]HCK0912856.1 ACP S-malonyltransferase [Klebsiella michiganensis]